MISYKEISTKTAGNNINVKSSLLYEKILEGDRQGDLCPLFSLPYYTSCIFNIL